jgi:hypothetical protein
MVLCGLAVAALTAAVAVPASADGRCDRDGRSRASYRSYSGDRYSGARYSSFDRRSAKYERARARFDDRRGFDGYRERASWRDRDSGRSCEPTRSRDNWLARRYYSH